MLYCFSKSKNQVVHEQKIKDLLSSTCQVSPERIVSDLGSEILGGLVSIQTEGNIFHCFSFVFFFLGSETYCCAFRKKTLICCF